MKLIVGLGNPGRDYEGTRHNIGFMVVDAIADGVSHTPWREDYKAELCSCTIAGEKVLLVKPQTFMNLSGESVGPISLHLRMFMLYMMIWTYQLGRLEFDRMVAQVDTMGSSL